MLKREYSRSTPLMLLGLYSLSGKTSYRKISWSLEAARFGFRLFQSLWNLAGTSAAALPRCLSNFRAILPLQHPISRLRDFTRFGGKTSYLLVNRGPELATKIHHVACSNLLIDGIERNYCPLISPKCILSIYLRVQFWISNGASLLIFFHPVLHIWNTPSCVDTVSLYLIEQVSLKYTCLLW